MLMSPAEELHMTDIRDANDPDGPTQVRPGGLVEGTEAKLSPGTNQLEIEIDGVVVVTHQ